MNGSMLILLVAFGLVFVIGLFIVAALWRAQTASGPDAQNQTRTYPEGHWMSQGISLGLVMGMALGLPLGIAMDNIAIGVALGPGFGLSIGVAIGAALERQHKNEIRPLTDTEKRARSRAAQIGIVALVLGVAVFGVVLLAVIR